MMKWQRISDEKGTDLMLFRALFRWFAHPESGQRFKRIVLDSADWVNVVATTPAGEFVMVRQFRFGDESITTEIPAGLVDPGEHIFHAAKRELLEETGYEGMEWSYLGCVSPNPAFLNNRCHHWRVRNVVKTAEPQTDDGEDIEILLMNAADLTGAIREGMIDHVLALSAFSRIPDIWHGITWTESSDLSSGTPESF